MVPTNMLIPNYARIVIAMFSGYTVAAKVITAPDAPIWVRNYQET